MDFDSFPPPKERMPPKDHTVIRLSSSSPPTIQIRQESSSDDAPIMSSRRPIKRDTSPPPRDRERRHVANEPNYRERPVPGGSSKKPSKPAIKKNGKPYKKPGPQPWAAKPIMKNDMVAKKAVIREIEGYWGKGFIRAFIPKVHRPLVKRGTQGKKAMFRAHETDPKKWLPSVLKAILMIAKLTNNKKWLKDAMNDVVRYRIKNTGNRKPQLVTTDFDVIEDMLVKDWAVDYAFEIRYKHLLVHRKDQQETDEDIDHILQVADDEDEEGSDGGVDDNDDDDMSEQDDAAERHHDEEEEEEFERGYGGISNKYQQSSGYTKGDRHTPVATPRQQAKEEKISKSTRIKSEPTSPPPMDRSHRERNSYMHGTPMPGYGGPQMNPWGNPMPLPYGGYSGFHGYPGFPGYGGPQFPSRGGRQGSQHPNPYGMYPPPHHMTPMPGNPYQQPPFGGNQMGPGSYQTDGSVSVPGGRQGSMRPKIKRESPGFDEPILSVDEINGPQQSMGGGAIEEEEDIDEELETAELELKLAKLRAKKAAQKKGR
ncbi:hypothetical protein NX059_011217 [Plenodomus lindquistii]|nr:hypothetical protein NX059_011217 [Plenodomus lindquistii]